VATLMVVAGYLAWADHRGTAGSETLAAPSSAQSSAGTESGPIGAAGSSASNGDSADGTGDIDPAGRASGAVADLGSSTTGRSALLFARSSTTATVGDVTSTTAPALRRSTATSQPVTASTTTPTSTTGPTATTSGTSTTTTSTPTTTSTQRTTTTERTTTSTSTTTQRATTTERTTTTEGRPAPVGCGLEGGVSSQWTRTDIWFTVDNRTNYDFELFWLDYNGRRVSYGLVGANSRRRQHTFVTHPWLLADPGSGFCRYLLPEATNGQVVTIG